MSVLFVCLGNIARSQMAEGYYRFFSGRTDVTSAGVSGDFHNNYSHPMKEAIAVMLEDGIDISGQLVKKLTLEMVNKSDKAFVLCSKEVCPAFLLESKKAIFWQVPDPYAYELEDFRKIRDLVKEKVKSII
jgi:arsenate reductase